MTGPQHYLRAEFLLKQATTKDHQEGELIAMMSAAQAHATLALAAATVGLAHDTSPHAGSSLNADEWTPALTDTKEN